MNDDVADTLRATLRQRAGDAVAVDLHERVMARSYRLRRRRAAASGAAAAVLTALVVGAFTILSPGSPAAPAPVAPTGPAAAPPTHQEQHLDRQRGSDPPRPASVTPAVPLPGPLVFADDRAPGGVTLLGWERTAKSLRILTTLDTDACAYALSPDGRRLSWVENEGDGTGRLVVAEVPLGSPRVIAGGLSEGSCVDPVWSADGRLVLFQHGLPGKRLIETVEADGTGRTRLNSGSWGRVAAWSADGRYLAAVRTRDSGVNIVDLERETVRRVPGVTGVDRVASISPDGRMVVLEEHTGADPRRGWFTPILVDTSTGRRPAFPYRSELLAAYFRDDGRLVVRLAGRPHNSIALLAADLVTTLSSIAEPAETVDLAFIGLPLT